MQSLKSFYGTSHCHRAGKKHAAAWRRRPVTLRQPACSAEETGQHASTAPAAATSSSSTTTTSSSSSSSSSPGLSQPSIFNSLPPSLLAQQALVMACAGATLGPLCDGLHSQHDVLHYTHPTLLLRLGDVWSFETCWWVPLLFGLAGLILGVGYPVLDTWAAQRAHGSDGVGEGTGGVPHQPTAPSWPAVNIAIALFVLQYWLSAVLDSPLLGVTAGPLTIPLLDVLLATLALAHWRVFDATPQGLAMSTLTAVAGPLVEIALINGLGLYQYSHPAVAGVPTWIPWTYFAGGPAVGLLGRRVWVELSAKLATR